MYNIIIIYAPELLLLHVSAVKSVLMYALQTQTLVLSPAIYGRAQCAAKATHSYKSYYIDVYFTYCSAEINTG